jgi:glycerophosphoryl diester phosphodiesterase
LPPLLAGGEATYRALVDAGSLPWLRGFAAALGPFKDDLLAADGVAPAWFARAKAQGFAVHPYTMRAEYDGAAQARALLELGVDGWFIDQPDLGVAVRDAFVAASAARL